MTYHDDNFEPKILFRNNRISGKELKEILEKKDIHICNGGEPAIMLSGYINWNHLQSDHIVVKALENLGKKIEDVVIKSVNGGEWTCIYTLKGEPI